MLVEAWGFSVGERVRHPVPHDRNRVVQQRFNGSYGGFRGFGEAQNLLGSDDPVGRMRGRPHDFGGIPLVVTYHPAYLLRSPSQKVKSWKDLCLASRLAAEFAA